MSVYVAYHVLIDSIFMIWRACRAWRRELASDWHGQREVAATELDDGQ